MSEQYTWFDHLFLAVLLVCLFAFGILAGKAFTHVFITLWRAL